MSEHSLEIARAVVLASKKEEVRRFLIEERNFTEKGAQRAVENFIDSIRYAGMLDEWLGLAPC